MKTTYKALAVLSLTAALAACSSSNDASKENFEKAIQAKLDKESGVCLPLPTDYKAGPLETLSKEDYEDEKNSEAVRMQALVDAGLYTKKDTQVEKYKMYAAAEKVPGYAFEMTDKAKKSVQSGTLGVKEVCTGKRKVSKIDNFTEPSNFDGMTISRVTYHYKIEDAEDWIKNDKVVKAYADDSNLQKLKEESAGHATVVKTKDGWVEKSQLNGGGL